MGRYDGLIIPRSYSEYINKADAATLSQALQLNGVLAQSVSKGNNAAVTSNAVSGALEGYQPIIYTCIAGGNSFDTGIYLNKSITSSNDFKYRKVYLLLLSTINGYGDTISTRLIMVSIGRSGNTITTDTIKEKLYSGSISSLNNIQFLPSQETTETNDNNTLIIKNNNSNPNAQVEVRFL